jgi:hyperosmotically inducible protein
VWVRIEISKCEKALFLRQIVMGARFAQHRIMKLLSLKLGLTLGALALAACANDKPATDASQTTTTTSARAPDGMMSSNPNDTNATGAATNESPNPSSTSSDIVTTTSTKQPNTSSNGSTASGTTSTTDTSVPQTRAHGNDAHPQTWGGGTGSSATPAPGSNGNAAGASQPGVTAPPPPPQNQNGGSVLTPIDQGNNPSDLKITQQIRKQVVSDSSLSFTAKNVKIITVNGRVTLRGQVNSDNEKKWIEATADKVVGNANVDNQITVKQ